MLSADAGLEDLADEVRRMADRGLSSVWMAQGFAIDALTALAVIGREVPTIELGTAVVPTYPRHPMVLAGQALTTQAACGGRLALGIGLSHQVVIERAYGYSFDRPALHVHRQLQRRHADIDQTVQDALDLVEADQRKKGRTDGQSGDQAESDQELAADAVVPSPAATGGRRSGLGRRGGCRRG